MKLNSDFSEDSKQMGIPLPPLFRWKEGVYFFSLKMLDTGETALFLLAMGMLSVCSGTFFFVVDSFSWNR